MKTIEGSNNICESNAANMEAGLPAKAVCQSHTW